jgi:hypothetical protein
MASSPSLEVGAPAPPLFATPRDPRARSEGARVALIADALGTPLLPWQRTVADTATELNPDGSYRYPVVVVSVPRQSGKTTLVRAIGTDRGLSRDDCGCFYTAQTGKDARERWQDAVKAVKASPLAPLATVRSAAGAERVVWPNGSTFRCFAPLPTSLHGYTPPLVMLDEAFAYDEQLGDDLMGAIGPAQVTIPHRQLWIVSTAGTARSVFLRRWIDAGLRGDPGVALFLWGCPEDVDVYDPSRWPEWHPAMHPLPDGRVLVTTEALRAEAARLPRSEFERAYGNRWTRTRSYLIAAEAWDALDHAVLLGRPQEPPRRGQDVVFAWDVMPDRSAAAIVAAWDDAGVRQWRVARSGPGTDWLPPALDALRAQGWRRFAYASDGPAREVNHPGAIEVGGRHYADAWGALLDHIAHRTMAHDGSDTLALAASNVATRPTLDSAAPSRRASAGDVTALLAGMVASYALDHHRPASGPIDVRFAS